MVNIYILTSDQKVYGKLEEGLQRTSYMDIAYYQLDSIDGLIDRIDTHQDVDVALISEDIVSQVSFNLIDRGNCKNEKYSLLNY